MVSNLWKKDMFGFQWLLDVITLEIQLITDMDSEEFLFVMNGDMTLTDFMKICVQDQKAWRLTELTTTKAIQKKTVVGLHTQKTTEILKEQSFYM